MAYSTQEGISTPKLSASAILLYPLRRITEDGYNYRILYLKRNSNSSTFVDAHVFPGGAVDTVDSSKSWDEILGSSKPDPDRLLKICAIRETFEESGILLSDSPPSFSETERWQWRQKVRENADSFIDLFKELGVKPNLSILTSRANWITPRRLKRRFDTYFYMSVLPRANDTKSFEEPTAASAAHTPHRKGVIVVADGKETVSAHWLTPLEATKAAISGSRAFQYENKEDVGCILFPPQFYLTAELINYKDWRSLCSQESSDSNSNSVVKFRKICSFEPQVRKVGKDRDGFERLATIFPGDELYTLPTPIQSAAHQRHRVYVVPTASESSNKPAYTSREPKRRLADGVFRVLGLERNITGNILGDGWEDIRVGIDKEGQEKNDNVLLSKL